MQDCPERVDAGIVLLHFFGSSCREWELVASRVGRDRRVLAIDLPGFGDAADSKSGIINLAKGLSKAYGEDNVRLNPVSPAFIHTPMTDKMMEKPAKENRTSVDQAIASFLAEEPPGMVSKRRGEPEKVAAMILFPCSQRASFIMGSNMRVHAGSVETNQ